MGPRRAAWLVATLLALVTSGCVERQVVVVREPPPDPGETVTTSPGADYVWIRGHWRWNGAEYVWVRGHWAVRRPGMVWVPGHWARRADAWVWIEGHWQRRP